MSGLAGPLREPSAWVRVSVWPAGPGRVVYGVTSGVGDGDELTDDEIVRVLRAAADYCSDPQVREPDDGLLSRVDDVEPVAEVHPMVAAAQVLAEAYGPWHGGNRGPTAGAKSRALRAAYDLAAAGVLTLTDDQRSAVAAFLQADVERGGS